MAGLLEGKKILVTGVVTDASIAFAIAKNAQEQGAEVLLTGFGRFMRHTERTAGKLPSEVEVLELDVNSDEDIANVRADLERRWGTIDGLVHAVAFAPGDALGGNFMTAPEESAELAFRTSAFSYKRLAAGFEDLLVADGGGAIVGLDFDAQVAWPVYDWMGVAKAALESVSRYVARDLGPKGVRSNLVSAGPIKTTAARGIEGFDQISGIWENQAPLGWDMADPSPVADTCLYLLSDLSRAVTGELIHVDGGYHAMGAPIVAPAPPAPPAETAE